MTGREPGAGELEAKAFKQGKEPAKVLAQADTAVGAGDLADHSSNGGPAGFGDRAVELHIGQHTLVVAAVNLIDRATQALGQERRQGAQAVIGALEGGDAHQGGDRFLGRGRLANGVKAAGQQAALDLH